MVVLGAGTQRPVRDYKLTRYACYLIAMNGDPRKEEVAFAQSYFAIAAHKQELIEQRMGELQRLSARKTLAESAKRLSTVAFVLKNCPQRKIQRKLNVALRLTSDI